MRWSDIVNPMEFGKTYTFIASNLEGSAIAGSNAIQIKAPYGSSINSMNLNINSLFEYENMIKYNK